MHLRCSISNLNNCLGIELIPKSRDLHVECEIEYDQEHARYNEIDDVGQGMLF